MQCSTGMLIESSNFAAMQPEQKSGYVEVKRPLTVRELTRMKINKSSPCGCGSGKAFRFCCFNPVVAQS